MSTNKLNEALGLGSGGIDEFLDSLTVDNAEFDQKFSNIDEKVKENVNNIDNQIQEYNKGNITIDVANIQSSLGEIKDLIEVSKGAIRHIYDSLVSSELVDAELAQALSKLMESSHIAISEYIQMYRDRMAFYDKVRLEMLKQQHKIEQMDYKHKLDMEKLNATAKSTAIETPNNAMVSYSQEELIKQMSKIEDN